MSVQFGRWNFEGQGLTREYVEKVSVTLAPYGPDNNEKYVNGGITILYRAFHTTNESHWEVQPHVTPSGKVIVWDGRLDNRAELIDELRERLRRSADTSTFSNSGKGAQREFTDVEIVAGAYERWGTQCLDKLIGDWALSIWNPHGRSVLLAKDPIGTRHLYYSIENDHVAWSTILDPLVLHAGRTFGICEEYIAPWFGCEYPAAHLTPYTGVYSVPPSSSVLLTPGKHGVKHIVSKYWDFNPGKRIRYRTDAEYEEHFRTVFSTAVQRTLRSDRPVLAHLSGGIDSSSIVCMADMILARVEAECLRLDTLTWQDKSLPLWGEPPHVATVEEKRGRVGHHIDAAALQEDRSPLPFGTEFARNRFAATPVPNSRTSEFSKQNAAYIRSQGYRVILSGIGGEFTGDGVPSPTPELQNLFARARFFKLAQQLKAWSAKVGKPRLQLLWDALRGFLPLMFQDSLEHVTPTGPWFKSDFVRRNRFALGGHPRGVKLFGPLPSFQDNLHVLNVDRRLFATCLLEPDLLCEMRFPFLDRDFLEFSFAIPREQTVGVGKRRFLIRRALVGIVPDSILNRKKKETASQEMSERMPPEWPSAEETGCSMVASSLGILDSDRLLETLNRAWRNEDVPIESLRRTLKLESWLRHLTVQGILKNSMATKAQENRKSLVPKELPGVPQPKSSAG